MAWGLGECGNLKFEICIKKIWPDPYFLDCGGLTPLWIFPSTRSIPIQSSVKPEHSKTPSLQQNVFGN
jgi:hypothetical protein